jgi:transketolase N-terminal domain/subunit/very-short-patch-repair endonuclease
MPHKAQAQKSQHTQEQLVAGDFINSRETFGSDFDGAKGRALKALVKELCSSARDSNDPTSSPQRGVSETSALVITLLHLGGILRFDRHDLDNPDRDKLMLPSHLEPLRENLYARIRSLAPAERCAAPGAHDSHLEDVPGILTTTPRRAPGVMLAKAIGAAHASRSSGDGRMVFLYLGEIELAKTDLSTGASLGANLGLDNLIVVMDIAGKPPPASTTDACTTDGIATTCRTHNWHVIVIEDGADPGAVLDGLRRSLGQGASGRPTIVFVRPPAEVAPPASDVSISAEPEQIGSHAGDVARLLEERLCNATLPPAAHSAQAGTCPPRSREAVGATRIGTPRSGGGLPQKATVSPTTPRGVSRLVPQSPALKTFAQGLAGIEAQRSEPIPARAQRLVDLMQSASQHDLSAPHIARIVREFDVVLSVAPDAFDTFDRSHLRTIRSKIAQSIKMHAATFVYEDARSLVYGLAVLGWHQGPEARDLLNGIGQKLDTFEPRQVKELCVAARKLNRYQSEFADALVHYYQRPHLGAAGTALIETLTFLEECGAFKKAHELIAVAAPQFGQLSDDHIAKIARTAVAVAVRESTVKELLAADFAARMKRTSPPLGLNQASTILHALASLDHYDAAVLDLFQRKFASQLKDLPLAKIQDVAWSYAILGEKSGPLFTAVANAATVAAAKITDREVVANELGRIAWASTRLGIIHQPLVDFIARHFDGAWDNLPPGALASFAWAFCLNPSTAGRHIVSQALRVTGNKRLEYEYRHQLRIAAVASGLAQNSPCPPEIQRAEERAARALEPNRFEKSVYEQLQSLIPHGLTIEPFHVVEGIATDFLVTTGKRRIIIECDGVRYHRTRHNARLGKDLIQDRVFANRGYEVLHILDKDWFQLKAADRTEFLRAQLKINGTAAEDAR